MLRPQPETQELLQVFWCHPYTCAAKRGSEAFVERYTAFLSAMEKELRRSAAVLPAGWRMLEARERSESLEFVSADGRQRLRCFDDLRLPFRLRVDERAILRMQDLFCGWHPNALHFEWTQFSQDPVPAETIREFARAFRECVLMQPFTREDVDVRLISWKGRPTFPPRKASARVANAGAYFLRVLAQTTADAAAAGDGDGDGDSEKKEFFESSVSPNVKFAQGWQTVAASRSQIDPRCVHVVVAPGESPRGAHTFLQLMARDRGAYCVTLPPLAYMSSAFDVSLAMRRHRGIVRAERTVVLLVKVAAAAAAAEATLTLRELVAFLQEWKDAVDPDRKRLLLVVRGGAAAAAVAEDTSWLAYLRDATRVHVWTLSKETGFDSPLTRVV